MPITLNHLLVFDAVAENASISRAAERLMVSQPAVSKQVKELERSLAVPLFDRLPKGVRPTAAGAMLAPYARRIVALRDEADEALRQLRGLSLGSLAIAASTTAGVYLLPELFVRYRRNHPGIRLHLEILDSHAIAQKLLAGTVDLGISEGEVDDVAIERSVLMQDELVAIAAPGHPLARKRAVRAERLCREPFVVRETGSESKSLVERALAGRGLAVKPVMSLGSTEAIKRAVAAGIGVAIVSRLAIELELKARTLVALRVAGLSLRRPVYQLRAADRHESAAVATFIAMLAERARGR